MKPFIPNILYAAKRKTLEQMPPALLCCEYTILHIAACAGQTVVLRMDWSPIEGVSNCLQCGASVTGFTGLHVYCDPADAGVNYGEAAEFDVAKAPLTKEEYERICRLVPANAIAAANRCSN